MHLRGSAIKYTVQYKQKKAWGANKKRDLEFIISEYSVIYIFALDIQNDIFYNDSGYDSSQI